MEEREKKITKILLGLIIFLLVVITIVSLIFIRAQKPEGQAKKEAITLAKKYADLKEPEDFYWFNHQKTYFTVTGKNKAGTEIVVIIPKSGEKVKIYPAKDGLSEAAARQIISQAHPDQPIKKASLGMYEEKPVWEVVTKGQDDELNYYLLSFEDGKEVKVINNI